MVPGQDCFATSGLYKMEPKAKLPAPATLATMRPADVRLLRRRLGESLECVIDPCFREPHIEDTLLAPPLELAGAAAAGQGNDDSGTDLLARGRPVPHSFAQEKLLFLRLNYCRWRVLRLMEAFAGRRLTTEGVGEFLRWEHLAGAAREEIVRANMPLVLAMAKRTRITAVDYADLISEGNLALLRSVEKFDCGRGYKFSTYACRAILKSFSRVASRTSRYRGHFPTEFDPSLEKSDAVSQRREGVEGDCVDELRSILGRNLAQLSHVEQEVIRARFALDAPHNGDGQRAKTLEQVGVQIGVTKERVRQIQNKALDKLRHALQGGILAS